MKVEKRLTETPEKGSVSEEYFYRMLSPQAVKHSFAYNREEENVVRRWLAANPAARAMNFVAVGAGELWYLKYALQYARRYVCIEPLAKIFLNDSVEWLARKTKNVVLLKKKFGDVKKREIPEGKSVYVFLFNILAYIEDPIVAINSLLRQGDVLIISSWNKTAAARRVRRRYFNYLNSFEKKAVINPEETVGLCWLENFPFESLKYYRKHVRITGRVTDILIIYT